MILTQTCLAQPCRWLKPFSFPASAWATPPALPQPQSIPNCPYRLKKRAVRCLLPGRESSGFPCLPACLPPFCSPFTPDPFQFPTSAAWGDASDEGLAAWTFPDLPAPHAIGLLDAQLRGQPCKEGRSAKETKSEVMPGASRVFMYMPRSLQEPGTEQWLPESCQFHAHPQVSFYSFGLTSDGLISVFHRITEC